MLSNSNNTLLSNFSEQQKNSTDIRNLEAENFRLKNELAHCQKLLKRAKDSKEYLNMCYLELSRIYFK